jgi:hypothetical protein
MNPLEDFKPIRDLQIRMEEMERHMGSGPPAGGDGMEPRVAKLEASVEHIQTDVADIKLDGRAVIAKLDDIKDSIASAKIWALLLYIGLAGGMLFVMAKGFQWLK